MNIKTTEESYLDENLTDLVEKYKRTLEAKNRFEEDNKNLRQKLDEVGTGFASSWRLVVGR